MKTVEYKLARLEEQNAALLRKLRHQENEISRLSVRESQLREVRRIPLLQKRLDAALGEREELECQLTETRRREVKLLDELNLLKKFVKLSENPELAEVARQCANYERIQEDLKTLGEQLRIISVERDEYKKRALLSCEEAEYYRDKWNASFNEKRELENYIRKQLAEKETANIEISVKSPSCYSVIERSSSLSVTPAEESHSVEDSQHLRQCLEEERARSGALQETIDALYEQQKEQRRSRSHERRLSSPPAPTKNIYSTSEGGDTELSIQTLRKQLQLSEGECKILRNRWQTIREENELLLARLSEQEQKETFWQNQIRKLSGECDQLKRQLEFFSQAKSMILCHHNESSCGELLQC
ncbi:uncharacterized protein TM35_000042950 [Trypanosoma theileri]|uniref:Uncharacterized protein n=1 Tax=Trypanosoma theileri TaxID=67003 RepID=A0A1X0P5H2_9TRYP|nr:uncharacterized protein TM35_000042950 [Trypanosoma theileri]ORC92081.1 hypothetical protein TM35_000042950 [Trypanosoma theileri]